jgi:altronate dehydratase small subunit
MGVLARVISTDDNVANLVGPGKEGQVATCIVEDQFETAVQLMERIPANHKFALKDISKGDLIIKYGQPIGTASRDIGKGQHVHVHNVESNRGRGDQKVLAGPPMRQTEELA